MEQLDTDTTPTHEQTKHIWTSEEQDMLIASVYALAAKLAASGRNALAEIAGCEEIPYADKRSL